MEHSKFDQLVYIVEESDMTPDEALIAIQELFPDYDPKSDNYNDKHLSDMNLDMYYYNRSLGLPVVEVVQSIKLSATLFSQIFTGKRVSLTKLVALAQAETFALSSMKAIHISALEKTDGVSANVIFLEKVFSDAYGDRKQLDINTGFGDTTVTSTKGWTVSVEGVKPANNEAIGTL